MINRLHSLGYTPLPRLQMHHLPGWADQTEEWQRICETAQRRRILYGEWVDDIAYRIEREVGGDRAKLWGEPELSANVALAAMTQVSQLYTLPAQSTGTGARRLNRVLSDAGWSALMQRVQRDCIAFREMHMRVMVDIDPESGEQVVDLTPVPPDLVAVRLDPRRKTRPVELWHYVMRDGRWTIDQYSIDGLAPSFRCVEAENKTDISPMYLHGPDGEPAPIGGFVGESYPFRIEGRPVLPWVTYHAAETGHFYDWRTMREVFDGTLSIAVIWTYWRHILQQASWPQRYVVGLDAAGSNADSEARYITPDPTLILKLVADLDAGGTTATAGSFDMAADVHSVAEALMIYERRVLAYAGLSPSQVIRSSGDPRSGYALAVTRDAQRESQAQFAPIFKRYDEQLFRLIAGFMGLPQGAEVDYTMLPPSAQEMDAIRNNVVGLLQAGLMTRRTALERLYPHLSPDQLDDIETQLDREGPDGSDDDGDDRDDAELGVEPDDLDAGGTEQPSPGDDG